ncbi:NAD(P)/FAD-dependent oxidoreductase [Pseudoteredinibacter isoporae]|uniref:NAD(P)/FAD-dependent oxidoreductase n=1 Tax=Pseudoteredinibacter isoporae TaxID=570281 RepID=UPI0031099B29
MSRCHSYYSASINQESNYPGLHDEQHCDVAIIGGGFTGVATALELAEKGFSVVLLEAQKIGWGATGRNGGQVTGSLSGDQAMLKQLRKQQGIDAEEFVWQLRWRGHDIIKKRVEKYQIDCDLKFGHLQTAYKPSHMNELHRFYDEAVSRGMSDEVHMISAAEIPDYLDSPIYHGGLLNRRNMHLHPLNLCLGEAKAASNLGVRIFENSPVLSMEEGDKVVLKSKLGKVFADRVMIAGNAYHKLGRPKLGGMLFPASLGNMATVPLGDELANTLNPHDLAVYDCRFVLDYYRLTADKRLMFGGGTNYSGKDSASVATELRPALERTFPRLKGVEIEFEWTGMAGIVINRIPQLGKVSDRVYYCQGYSGHGVACSHIMAEIMSNAIAGHMEEFDTFAAFKHLRVPINDWLGNQALVLGMWYYQLLEKLR